MMREDGEGDDATDGQDDGNDEEECAEDEKEEVVGKDGEKKK